MQYAPLPSRSVEQNSRWRWWYVSIADIMIRHPSATDAEIASFLNRHPGTITSIKNSDAFKVYFSQRQADFAKTHDTSITNKLTEVAEKGLDIILQVLEKKQDKLSFGELMSVTTAALNRVGHPEVTKTTGAGGPSVQVNVGNQQVVAPISREELERSRDLMRASQRAKILEAQPLQPGADPLLDADLEDNVKVVEGSVASVPAE